MVEDRPLLARALCGVLRQLGYTPLGPVSSAAAALAACQAGPWPDVLLLDICLPGAPDCIALAEQLLAAHPRPLLVLTACTDEATFGRARALRPAAFLRKPVAADDLRHALALAVDQLASALNPPPAEALAPRDPKAGAPALVVVGEDELLTDALFVKENGQLRKVALADVQWAEANGKQCWLVLADGGRVAVRLALGELARRLPPRRFVQIHRRYVVNVKQIARIDPVGNLVLVGTQPLPLSASFRDELLRRLAVV